jgi:FixJ family two-component response regulator
VKTERTHVHDLRTYIDTLTQQEYEIFRYIINNILNKQIALNLGITGKTINAHRGRIQ